MICSQQPQTWLQVEVGELFFARMFVILLLITYKTCPHLTILLFCQILF